MTDFIRLTTVAPDLIAPLRAAPPHVQRAIAADVCTFALERAGLTDPTVAALVSHVAAGTAPETRLLTHLETVLSALDARYFDLLDAVHDRGAPEAPMVAAFSVARAVNAVQAALVEDPFLSVAEALYEANAATDAMPALRRIIAEHLATGSAA